VKLIFLEITESSAMQNVEKTIKTLRNLKAMGVRISLDDFGTVAADSIIEIFQLGSRLE